MVHSMKYRQYITSHGKFDGLLNGMSLVRKYWSVLGSYFGDSFGCSKEYKYGHLDSAPDEKSLGKEDVINSIGGAGYF